MFLLFFTRSILRVCDKYISKGRVRFAEHWGLDEQCEADLNKRKNGDQANPFIGKNGTVLVCGIIALGSYWAWMFVTYSSVLLAPFGSEGIYNYLILIVIAAGSSTLSMLLLALFPNIFAKFLIKKIGTVVLSILSSLICIPALISNLGFEISFTQALAPWIISSFISSYIFVKAGTFLTLVDQTKLFRCVSLSFLGAAMFYLLALFLTPIIGIIMAIVLPTLSCICVHYIDRHTNDAISPTKGCPAVIEKQRSNFIKRMLEYGRYAPLTLIYTISFGIVSYFILYLAFTHNMILIIAISILVSATFALVCSFFFIGKVEIYRIRLFMLPLIAVALLPLSHLTQELQICFLSIAIFGFKFFDVFGLGGIANEIKKRELEPMGHLSAAAFIGYVGIFLGWLVGFLLFATLGASDYRNGLDIISVVLVVLLLVTLIAVVLRTQKSDDTQMPIEFRDKFNERCAHVAKTHRLTNQETRIFILIASRESYGSIADKLYISRHTVKSHIFHIYQKLGIHSQQELIDLVRSGL